MPNQHYGSNVVRPDEGQYDIRKGAAAYSPILGSIASIAVAAIVVVFTSANELPRDAVALAVGLLLVGFLGSLLASFGLAAIGAENDPTANLGAAILFLCAPIVGGIVATLGAFQVLAAHYVPDSLDLFRVITVLGGGFGVVFSAFGIVDSHGLHPTTMSEHDFDQWLSRQWIQSRAQGLRIQNRIMLVCEIPILASIVTRLAIGYSPDLNQTSINTVTGVGIGLTMVGTWLGLSKSSHPKAGNDQRALRRYEAWTPIAAISLYTCVLVFTLP